MIDAMIAQKEEASDSDPWENVHHNDRLRSEKMTVVPSHLRGQEETEWKYHFLPDSLLPPYSIMRSGRAASDSIDHPHEAKPVPQYCSA